MTRWNERFNVFLQKFKRAHSSAVVIDAKDTFRFVSVPLERISQHQDVDHDRQLAPPNVADVAAILHVLWSFSLSFSFLPSGCEADFSSLHGVPTADLISHFLGTGVLL